MMLREVVGEFLLFCLCYVQHFQHLLLVALLCSFHMELMRKAAILSTSLLAVTAAHVHAHCALKRAAVTFQMQMEQQIPSTEKMSTSSALALLLRTTKLAAG